jgi:hypothetical protein
MRALVAFAAGADADGVGGFFLVSENQDVGDFLVGEVADFGVHFFVAVVGFDSRPAALSSASSFFA